MTLSFSEFLRPHWPLNDAARELPGTFFAFPNLGCAARLRLQRPLISTEIRDPLESWTHKLARHSTSCRLSLDQSCADRHWSHQNWGFPLQPVSGIARMWGEQVEESTCDLRGLKGWIDSVGRLHPHVLALFVAPNPRLTSAAIGRWIPRTCVATAWIAASRR